MYTKDHLFWFCALAGSGMFLIQFLLTFIGLDSEDGENSSSPHFKWLSKQAITGFLMMFGWVGLACEREFGLSPAASISLSIASGICVIFISGSLFKLARKLRSSGTVFRIEEAIGKQASVYQRIPKNGIGKISISLQQMTCEIDALSEDGEEISSFSQVKIIKQTGENTVVVVPIYTEQTKESV